MLFSIQKIDIFFLFLHENLCYGYSLEAPRQRFLWVPTMYVFVEK